jgi:uncharacterized membrane protein YkoI
MINTNRLVSLLGTAACTVLLAGAAHAQSAKPAPAHQTAEEAKMHREAKLTEADARAIAMKEVPNGKIQSGELEREGGKLIYSFDIKVPGKSGIEEVNVNAMTGALVAHEHETPKAEKKEAALEAKEKKSTKKP